MSFNVADNCNANDVASTSSNAKDDSSIQFKYDNESIEVVIIENGDDDRDGYVELNAAAKLIAPIATIRGFNKAVLWTNVLPSHKLVKNNKNYVHVFALCKYLSLYNLSTKRHKNEYYIIKRLVSDLIVGAQSEIIDPINDIKNQLCNLQECISGGSAGMYHSTTTPNPASSIECFKEMLRHEMLNVNNALDNIKSMQSDFTNKLAFSNDTMLDSFKSIKDIIIRKK
ncbi:p24 [Euproctis pseudoconspersa nucleopolyhedrovirus]|uniref:p24 n=1 Tax=Euproctis pseudoconspersa nucleopolyhedrovirus TaxID=307467 RepID=Q599G3_9ABAC|nr:p24 [Euproctis pseudoconspersa nucleopolyhedrovirus]ACO53575.1 p24 [Euproctis pseudoconspersa nucleopolyhedrovirus]QUJ09315.1 p24 protein [Gynaephora ruoergensis nucleopolyhedrovirus]CAI72628.1 P24 protein [Euproctis pseudoconspersa nucleopolyhedrovirus]